MENVKGHLENIKVHLDELDSESKLIYEDFKELSENVDVNIDNFDNSVSSACIEYLRKINDVQNDELVNNERTLNLKYHYDIFVKFQSKLRDIMNEYSDIFTSNDDIVSNICYNDNTRSNQLNLSIMNRYHDSYYYNKYNSDRRTESNDNYIDPDHKNADLLIKYMNDDIELVENINKMNFEEKFQFLQDLDFFNLPVKLEYLVILGFNKDNRIMEGWRKRKVIIVNDKWLKGISDELRKNGKMEEIYNGKLLNDIKYDGENNCFGIDVEMKYPDIIESYLNNGRKWIEKTLILKGLKIEDIINEMNKFGMNLSDDEKKELEEIWMSVRYVFVNDSYNQSIDDYMKKEHNFIDLYLNNMNNEEINSDGFLFVNVNITNVDVIEKYLNNDRKWRRDGMLVKKLKYSDILNDFSATGSILCEEDNNKLKLEWMKLRKIWVNDDYKQSIDRYLKSNDKFIEIYESNISDENYDDYDDTLYVNIKLKYEQVFIDYITHDQHLNIELIKNLKNYKYDDFTKELQLIGIKLNNDTINSLNDPSIFSFSSISRILDKKYDEYLIEWLGDEYKWKCIYRASEHGYTAQSFHEYCDDVGPTLILIKSHNGYIFGGHTTQSWKKNDNEKSWERKIDNDAFLFTLYNPHDVPPTRYNALKNKSCIGCFPIWGPLFCDRNNSDIYINGNSCNEENSCYINSDGTGGYECDPQYKCSLFVNTAKPNYINYFSVSEYEVFAHI